MALAARRAAKAMASYTFVALMGGSLMGGYAFAQAKKESRQAHNYYNAGTASSPNWQPLTGQENQDYVCDVASNICTAYFDHVPSSGEAAPENARIGQYIAL